MILTDGGLGTRGRFKVEDNDYRVRQAREALASPPFVSPPGLARENARLRRLLAQLIDVCDDHAWAWQNAGNLTKDDILRMRGLS